MAPEDPASRRVRALKEQIVPGGGLDDVRGATVAHTTEALSNDTSHNQTRPSPGGGPGSLTVIDNRTGKRYQIPIELGGYVRANAFGKITAAGDGNGLKLFDPGYTNTAPCKSRISFIDGEAGILRYRGYKIEELAEKSAYLETSFALIYGDLPNEKQLSEWSTTIMRHSALPVPVIAALEALPHDAHPMGVILAGKDWVFPNSKSKMNGYRRGRTCCPTTTTPFHTPTTRLFCRLRTT